MHHAVDHIGRLGMRRRVRCLKAAALINRHINDHGPRLHARNHVCCHQFGRSSPWNQHAADHQICIKNSFFNIVRR